MRHNTNLLKILNPEVIPAERPTVPAAETTSTNTSINVSFGSAIKIKSVLVVITIIAKVKILKALIILSAGIRRLKAVTGVFVAIPLILRIMVKKVVVLIPPPVDPGDAPINIKTDKTSNPACVKLPIGTVQKPAVRAETLWKKASIQLNPSVIFNKIVPTINSVNVIITTIFVFILSFLKFRFT